MGDRAASPGSEIYRPEYVAALNLLARACRIVLDRGLPAPILVGGAVVEFDTAGTQFSGDFDLVSSADEAVTEALLAVGFLREDRPRLRVVSVPDGEVFMAPTEDLIADRLGQWVSSRRRDGEVLAQARVLFALADDLDEGYLDARIRQETAGELGLTEFRSLGDEADEPG